MSLTNYFEPSHTRTICFLFDQIFECEKQAIWCSKELLATASPIFKAMFYGKFGGQPLTYAQAVILRGKNLNDFLTVVTCLSPTTDRLKVDQTNVRVIYPLADEYQIKLLIKKCLDCFMDGLSKLKIGDETILNDLPFFVKYGLIPPIEYIIPYAAALDIEIIDKYRRNHRQEVPADHPFYFAVYEAKAHR